MSKPFIAGAAVGTYTSLRGQNVAAQFATAQSIAAKHSLSSQSESYMWKSSTWGAVAYLSDSAFGRGTSALYINNSSSYYAGCAGSSSTTSASSGCSYGFYTTNGVQASTTANVYGVYDLSGGTSENTMAVYNSKLVSSGFAALPATKYVDVFANPPFGSQPSWSSSTNMYAYNWDVCTWELCGGHALHETQRVQSNTGDKQAWDNDTSWFVDDGSPWQYRGYPAANASDAGLWCASSGVGNWSNHTFRTVISNQ
jgi:hypothetical protein